ncbi:MAG: hypothetical protein IJG37_10845 [Synergistaceae bacterium]|nr:hypothetical protein [Synergistaceae bacterium]
MSAKKTHNLLVSVGEYEGRNGQTYKNWENVGYILKYDDGGYEFFLKSWVNMSLLPTTKEGYVRVRMFPAYERGEKAGERDRSGDSFQSKEGGKVNAEAWNPDSGECPF